MTVQITTVAPKDTHEKMCPTERYFSKYYTDSDVLMNTREELRLFLKPSRWMLPILVLLGLSTLIPFVSAQASYSFQISAYGDTASLGNFGVGAKIHTHVFVLPAQDWGAAFWVGDILLNGSFIQFGYSLYTPASYCLYGKDEGGKDNCMGSYDTILANDPRWFWQYWPDANVTRFYFGNGPLNSAGPEGSWHTYRIMPNSNNGWAFVLDGKNVASVDYPWMPSRSAVYVNAEEGSYAPSPSGTLGPVEFKDISYYEHDGWHQVNSLRSISGCAVITGFTITECSTPIPYGLTEVGPNDITAGSGQQEMYEYELIWSNNPLWLTMSGIMFGGALLICATFVGNGYRKKMKRKQQLAQMSLCTGAHCLACGNHLPSQVNFCPECGNKVKRPDLLST